MKTIIPFIIYFYCNICSSQTNYWELSGGWGISGVNQIIKNDISLEKRYKFHKVNNLLDNKFRNNILRGGYLTYARYPSKGFFNGYKLNVTFMIYDFGSTFYKEEKFFAGVEHDDTINTPNWLVSKYTLPCLELGIAKKIKIHRNVNVEIGVFCSYMVELSGTSRMILYDSVYSVYNKLIYYYNKEEPNLEYNNFNFGIRTAISIFENKKIHPNLLFTQCLNDLSRKNIHIAQHANLWSINIGLVCNFNNENKIQGKKRK